MVELLIQVVPLLIVFAGVWLIDRPMAGGH